MNFDDFLVKGLVEYLVNITLLFMFRVKFKVNICLRVKIFQIVSQKNFLIEKKCIVLFKVSNLSSAQSAFDLTGRAA